MMLEWLAAAEINFAYFVPDYPGLRGHTLQNIDSNILTDYNNKNIIIKIYLYKI
jgi:hypothetical protein